MVLKKGKNNMEKKYSAKISSRQRIRAGLAAFVTAGLVMGAYGAVSAETAENPAGNGPGITIGKGSMTKDEGGISIGNNAKINNTNADDAIAIGRDAEASYGSIVIGKGTRDHDGKGKGSTYSVIIGNEAKSLGGGTSQVILGSDSWGQGSEAMAIGSSAHAKGEKSITIGSMSEATGFKATALGGESKATGEKSTAIGGGAESQAGYALALGSWSEGQVYEGVALGSWSVANREGFTEEKKGVFSDFDLKGKTYGAVSVGTKDKLRQIINVGDATEDTDAVNLRQLKALSTKVDNSAIHYFSVNSKETGEGSNYKNDGAKGKGAVAIGEKAMASKGGTVSIGRNAHIEGNGGNASGEGSVAIGDNSLITTNGLDLASIAIGKNAKVLNGSGKQERGLSFMPDNFAAPRLFRDDTLPKNADKVPGGIAIGTNSYARTGSIQLGHHTFAGYQMGGIDVTNANEEANIVGMTTIGTNTYNKGALANMYGAYSIITGAFTGEGGMNSLNYGPQNFGANVVGSLNSIRSKGHDSSSGVANSIVGVANTVENTNGTLVYGAGNKITNSIKYISPEAGFTTLKSWEDTVTGLQKVIKDSNSGGAVLAIGGGNVADYVQHSQLVGVNNTVTGTEKKVSEFNMVNGYQNTATNTTHVTMIGSENEVKDTTGAVLLGDKRKLTGADGSIVLGSADADDKVETNVKDATVIGHNANTTVASGVALGSDSVANREKADAEKVYLHEDAGVKATVKGDLAAVSVGNTNATRQITGVAAGTEDTDAVNVAQLKAAAKDIAGSITDTKLKADTNGLSLDGTKLNLSVKDTAGNTVTGSVDLKDFKGAAGTTYTLEGEENDNNTTTIFLKGSDNKEQQVTVATKDTRNTIVESDTVAVEATEQEDKSVEYKLNVKTDGKVEKDNKGIVTGGTVYNETRIEKDGKYIKVENTAGQNLTALDKQVGVNTTNITKLGNSIDAMGDRVNRVGAGAAALAALHPLDFDPDDKWDFAAGYGNYKGANAAAIGAYYRPNEDTMFSVGGSFGGGENMVNAGISVKLGQGNHVSTSKVAMAKDMLAMQKRMAEMEAQMAKMQGFIGALTGMDTQTAMFPDVPENHWAYEYVKGLCEQGIIEGYPDGNFNGNRSMTRYEFAAMLYRALAKGVNLDARAVKEFAPELGRIRVDVISQNKEGQPVIERVRVNEEKKEK